MIKRADFGDEIASSRTGSNQSIVDRRLSLTITDAMYRELTMRKLDEGRSYNAILIDALHAYLRKSAK